MESNARETLYREQVEALVEKWAEGKPPNPAAESPTAKPSGYYRLSGWLLEYLMEHDELPSGVHAMPRGMTGRGEWNLPFRLTSAALRSSEVTES